MSAYRLERCPCCTALILRRPKKIGWWRCEWVITRIARTEEEKQQLYYALDWEGWHP